MADVAVTNTDNDTAGITVTPTSGLTTTEAGGTATFTVVADDAADRGRDASRSARAIRPKARSARRASPLRPANWNVAQTVTVTGVDDAAGRRRRHLHIVTAAATSTDAIYNGINAADVAVTNTDNDGSGITVTPDRRPDDDRGRRHGDVHGRADIAADGQRDHRAELERHDRRHGRPASLTFTTANWNMAQTVTVTGVDDRPRRRQHRLHDRDCGGDQHRRDLQRVQRE